MNKKINYLTLINIFIKIFILGAIFSIPLIFDAFSFLDSPTVYPKIVFLYVFVFALFVSTIFKVLYLEKVKIRKQVVKSLLWPSIFILILFGSSLLAFDVKQAFLGSYSRQFGFLTYFFFYLWFVLIVFNVEIDAKLIKIKEVYKTIAISSFFVSLYAVLQYFGYDFLRWLEPAVLTKRAFSTFGQPNFLGLFLTMTIPVTIYLVAKERNRYFQYLWGFISLFSLLALIFTYSRSAWLGLLFSALVFLFYLYKKKKKVLKNKVFILLSSLLLLIIITSFSQSNIFHRLKSSLNFNNGSVAVRLMYFKASINKIAERPIIGFGLEQQKDTLISQYEKDWSVFEKINSSVDRAHNIILDYLLIGGILLLVAYILIIKNWFSFIYKDIKKGESFLLPIAFSLLAYFVAMMFSFATTSVALYFWLFGALIVAFADNKSLNYNYEEINISFSKKIKKILFICLALIFFLFFYLQIQKIIANHYFFATKRAISIGNYGEALLLHDYGLSTGYNHSYYDRHLVDSISYYLINNEKEPYRELALRLEDVSNNLNINTHDNLLAKGRVNSVLGNYSKARDYYFQAIDKTEKMPKTYVSLGDNYFLEGNFNSAIDSYDIALDLIPTLEDERINFEHRDLLKKNISLVLRKKGDVYYKQDRFEEAIAIFKKAYNHNLDDLYLLKKIADSYYALDDISMTIFYNKKGAARDPYSPFWPTALASLYYEKGQNDKVELELEKALRLDKNYKRALNLKKEIINN